MSKQRLIIGLMSGTSVDGIDAALVRVTGGPTRVLARRDRLSAPLGRYRAEVLAHVECRWPEQLRGRLLGVMAPAATTTQEICELNMLVAREFAGAVAELLRASGVSREEVAAIASHGQTICHLPGGGADFKAQISDLKKGKAKRGASRRAVPGAGFGSTLQIGDISALATLTGIRTIGNFRSADMAVGGQGAPLVPWADEQLFSHATLTRCLQNIGGIANVTYLPAVGRWSTRMPGLGDKETRRQGEGVLAFDTGPGNMLMDAVVRMASGGREHFDRDGRMAARGKLCERLLKRLQAHPYFARRPPKSTGREAFGETYARRLAESYENRKVAREDMVHTLTRLTAWSIGEAYRRFLPGMPDEVIVCGGGADNPVLVGMLGEDLAGALGGVRLRRIDELGMPNKAKEAASFALLGAATLDGVAGNLPSVTGARRAVVLGEMAGAGEALAGSH